MLDIEAIWEKAESNPSAITPEEIQALINNRLWYVTERLETVSRNNVDEALFDLMMLVFDSLTEKRACVLSLWETQKLSDQLICETQAQVLTAIDGWHQTLGLHWDVGRYVQNLLFLCALIYAANVWKDDTSADNSKVMAKIDEMIRWMKATKTAPLDVLEKLKGMVGG
ncbi:MAG: hypothetical protein ACK4V2_03585 [Pseudomonadota bacterium]|nr:hypothetical protein [Alphaproteobacteria bacterium]